MGLNGLACRGMMLHRTTQETTRYTTHILVQKETEAVPAIPWQLMRFRKVIWENAMGLWRDAFLSLSAFFGLFSAVNLNTTLQTVSYDQDENVSILRLISECFSSSKIISQVCFF